MLLLPHAPAIHGETVHPSGYIVPSVQLLSPPPSSLPLPVSVSSYLPQPIPSVAAVEVAMRVLDMLADPLTAAQELELTEDDAKRLEATLAHTALTIIPMENVKGRTQVTQITSLCRTRRLHPRLFSFSIERRSLVSASPLFIE